MPDIPKNQELVLSPDGHRGRRKQSQRIRMKIRVDKIPESGLHLDLSYEKDWLKSHQKGHREGDFEFITPVTARLELSRSQKNIFIEGELKGKLKPLCSRCLKSFNYNLGADFQGSLTPLPQRFEKEEIELSGEDVELSFYQGGEIDLKEGVIIAQRHIHMSPDDARSFGIKDGDIVKVKVAGKRALIFDNVMIRSGPTHKLDFHIDIDEANAAELSQGDLVEIIKS